MAGTVTITYDFDPDYVAGGTVKNLGNISAKMYPKRRKVTFDWTSSAGGAADGTTDKTIRGVIEKIVTNPGATAPTDNYDVALTDADGVNILADCFAPTALDNRDTANSEQVVPLLSDKEATAPRALPIHPMVNSTITIAVTTAGASKVGSLTIYYRDDEAY